MRTIPGRKYDTEGGQDRRRGDFERERGEENMPASCSYQRTLLRSCSRLVEFPATRRVLSRQSQLFSTGVQCAISRFAWYQAPVVEVVFFVRWQGVERGARRGG